MKNIAAGSAYLDGVRAFAAMYVFLYHFSVQGVIETFCFSPKDFLHPFRFTYPSAHTAVVIFFVLSGMLVSQSTMRSRPSFGKYISDRIGRLYSVMLPALIFSFLAWSIVSHYGRFSEANIPNAAYPVTRFLINAAFLSQVWSLAATPPLNNPMWSLSYEFMYYMIFGAATFLKGNTRLMTVIVLVIACGLKILLLAPCWFVGVAVAKASPIIKSPSNNLQWKAVFLISGIAIFGMMLSGMPPPLWRQPGDHLLLGSEMYFSWNWASDYVVSLLIGLNLLAHKALLQPTVKAGPIVGPSRVLARTAGFLASCSFTWRPQVGSATPSPSKVPPWKIQEHSSNCGLKSGWPSQA